jgi:hypothetical protein
VHTFARRPTTLDELEAVVEATNTRLIIEPKEEKD